MISHLHTSATKLHRDWQCEESSRFWSVVQPAAGTHWSEDTLGLPPNTLARCVLTPRDSKSVSGVNFPLSTYSVFGQKNVSRENENILVWPLRM
jgi:hypothetical protein